MENIHAYVLLYNNEVFLTLKAWDAVADGIVLLSDQPEVEAEFETFFSANLRREARGHLVLAEVDSSDVDRSSGRNLSPFGVISASLVVQRKPPRLPMSSRPKERPMIFGPRGWTAAVFLNRISMRLRVC